VTRVEETKRGGRKERGEEVCVREGQEGSAGAQCADSSPALGAQQMAQTGLAMEIKSSPLNCYELSIK